MKEETELDGVDLAKLEAAWSRWKHPATWILCCFAILLFYLLAYPALYFGLDQLSSKLDAPEWVDTSLEFTVLPLIYLDENVDLYENYIRWLGKMLHLD